MFHQPSAEVAMTVTSHLFEAFLKCSTKCFLRSLNETATGNEYADWVRTQQVRYQTEGIERLRQGVTPAECVTGPPTTNYGKPASWRLAIDCLARSQNLESTIHAVEQVPSEAPDKPLLLIPIRFIFNNRIG